MATTAVSQPTSEDSKPIVGIIYPPPNIRETVDTAAAFLANKPPQLEDRIRENERHNPKFCFLNPSDPYHAYYQFKLQEAREGKTTKKPGKEDKVEQQQPKEQGPPKQPEAFEFSAQMPAMSAQDLDIMKLTAQFAARNGRNFINQLSQRESRNYQFDFLRPSHSLFPFFTELVKQYTKVLVPPKDMKQKLKANAETKYRILDRVKERVEWVAWVEAEKKKKEDEDEKERLAYASIDWHDFIIVETIDFTEADDQMDIPPPMSLSELENMSLAQKRMNAMAEQPQEEDKPADMEMDDVDMEEESDKEEEEVPSQPAEIPKIPDSNVPVKVRTDYKPKLLGVTPQKANEPTQVCPRCGVAFPISEMDEHMRVELLDPKWKEQKLAMEAKMKDSNLLQEGTDVAKILKNFAGYRSDMFGEEETSIGKKIDEAEEEAKKKERVTWDGHTATINLATQRAQQSTSIEEQIAAIHRSKGFTPETYGPRIPEAAPIEQPPQSQPQQQQPQPPYGSPAAPQAYYSAPPQATPIPRPDPSGAFNNQLPNMYMQQPPLPAMGIPPPLIGTNIRKAEDNLDQTELKRARFENGQPAEGSEWTQQPTELSIKISTPNMPDKPEWNLTGNTIVLSGLAPGTLVSTVKDRISSQLGMPAGKQKLTTSGTSVVLNNSKSLEFYGLGDGVTLILGIKDKGKK
ncbi:Pre-mRNA splicing factor PRP21 like protein-domain-containing protein, partial [Dichotomocladium elegans]